ncbi:hypothetical protein EDD18DRAFT_1154869 [Armillaria luteobubalina]|uniref:Carboxylesterase type B domain-containing protein n=1 Tax=Armillaria luteobubalina TaxID=153913 RepID=A0AA39UQX9_9AGAR|nr:hypothetical protein EDD18DRAFT_1154869 [Armillaria luteobubalina]
MATAHSLSVIMMNYWMSFATSLDPNNGLSSERPLWPQYTPNQQEKIDFIIPEGAVFRHRRQHGHTGTTRNRVEIED